MEKIKIPYSCNHTFTKRTTMWKGIFDKMCRRCGHIEITQLPENYAKLLKTGYKLERLPHVRKND